MHRPLLPCALVSVALHRVIIYMEIIIYIEHIIYTHTRTGTAPGGGERGEAGVGGSDGPSSRAVRASAEVFLADVLGLAGGGGVGGGGGARHIF